MSAVVDAGHRPLGLETDMANQNFAGARNPDDLLWVQFSMKPIPNNFRSEVEGRPIFEDQMWIEIRVPGNQLLTIERPVTEQDKFRFPRHWAYFQQTKGPDGQNVGTPLAQWPLLRPSQVEELRALKFYTVEQVSLASDDQLKTLGMGPGMAPSAFRERAKLYLETARDNQVAAKQAEEIKKRDEKIADMEAKLNQLLAAAKPDVQPVKVVDAEREALAAQYQQKFNKKPHHKMNSATLREKLAA